MRVRVTTTFIDKQAKDPADAEIKEGRALTVSQERGDELIAAGVAILDEPKKSAPRKRQSARKAADPALAPSPPAPAVDTVPGSATA